MLLPATYFKCEGMNMVSDGDGGGGSAAAVAADDKWGYKVPLIVNSILLNITMK